jgi:hypothetical protein
MKGKTGSLYYTKRCISVDAVVGSIPVVSILMFSMDYSTQTIDDIIKFDEKIKEIQSGVEFMHWSNIPLVESMKGMIKLEKRKSIINKVLRKSH